VSAYLHAAAMVKAGIFLLMRFTPAFAELPLWNFTLITFGLVTAVIGAVFALQQHDLKELAAYSTVSQLGLLVAVIGVGTEAALVAAAVHTLAHALFKASLFMVVGVVDHQAHTRDL
ncbi:proton-conducting transporter transmembrane domain-containing protein, partial [Nocardiopsis alkaliphila]|uniref:proton-conducting transporter transmembrane domain-containing protein n=1 Tax=Nocardiopsis alkaliphila TaxID=225762 RepID=UPI000526FCB0